VTVSGWVSLLIGARMNIKMIVLDLDGTLLHDDKTISEYSKIVIQKCREKGIKVIFATVRGTIDDIRGLLLACDKAGLEIVADDSDDDICYTNFTVTEVWSKEHKKVDFAEMNFNSDKIYVENIVNKAVDIIKNHLPKGSSLFISRDNIAFISHEEALKSKATAALAERWNIKQEEILCFGDDLIDIEILKYCGIGVAMGNALNEVKTAADYICDTNNNDGVAKWIEERIL